MILSCNEIDTGDLPVRKFAVVCTAETTPADVQRLCSNIPVLRQAMPGWKLKKLDVTGPMECSRIVLDPSEAGFTVWAEYQDVPLDEEEQFPPFEGPRGLQPDGSFILTPRCYAAMKEMFLNAWIRIPMPRHKQLDRFREVVSEDTGVSFEEYT